ncbi:hypothetical protein DFH09DRAFT_1095976 [Mycena vulgaris]|nr:hypothetical protein DFH09DRAFT_1095955 [Mycena vulgaris]KAJ6524713.1 hypothetical protein DFH09DRAFT_1095976 [Mycena vulgaris]
MSGIIRGQYRYRVEARGANFSQFTLTAPTQASTHEGEYISPNYTARARNAEEGRDERLSVCRRPAAPGVGVTRKSAFLSNSPERRSYGVSSYNSQRDAREPSACPIPKECTRDEGRKRRSSPDSRVDG